MRTKLATLLAMALTAFGLSAISGPQSESTAIGQ
jgi:hypothetical protein